MPLQCQGKKIVTCFLLLEVILGQKKSREFPGFPGTLLEIPVSRELQNGREIGNTSHERTSFTLK